MLLSLCFSLSIPWDIQRSMSKEDYPEQLINNIRRIRDMNSGDLFKDATGKRDRRGVLLVVNYSSHPPIIKKLKINIFWNDLKIKTIFNHDILVSYKRCRNIVDILVKKNLTSGVRTSTRQNRGRLR